MLFEYAVDPTLLADFNNCRIVLDNFKPEQGRLVADVPRKWIRDAYQAIQSIPFEQCQPVMRKSIKERLKKLLGQSLCNARQVPAWDRGCESWLEYVASANNSYPFAAVITEASVEEPVQTYAASNLFLDAPATWKAPLQRSVPRNAKDIVDALMPLFCISKQIILIDRHLYPGTPRSLKVLKEIIARADQYNFGRGIDKLVLHSSDHRKDMQSSLEQRLLPSLPVGFEVICNMWPKAIEHDRFAITDVGGISLGEGLDERAYQGTEDVLMGLIDFATRKRLLSKFSGTPTYRASIKK